MVEKRKHDRRDFIAVIEYGVRRDAGTETCKGVAADICESGFSLYLFRLLARGEEIMIRTELPVSPRTASVRWIRRIDGNIFKAGLMFV
ncbi:MAG: hypothetical protein M0Z60_02590 [Nitrospiraceae bacterium]|nr:hypothetical protein [Nitrospiraceae bacterium]